MRYCNSTTDKWYNEGDSMTYHIDENTLFSGVPTSQQLASWGYEPYVEPTHEPTLDELKAEQVAALMTFVGYQSS